MPPEDSEHEIDRLISLLARARQCPANSNEGQACKREAIEIIEKHLHDEIRCIVQAKFGPQMDRGSRQFTALLNSFFVDVLKRSSPGPKVETRKQLIAYVTTALSNILIDHLKAGARHREKFAEIAQLAAQRQAALDAHGLELQDVLLTLNEWEEKGDAKQLRGAEVVRRYFITGMTFAQIGAELDIGKSTADRILKASLEELRYLHNS